MHTYYVPDPILAVRGKHSEQNQVPLFGGVGVEWGINKLKCRCLCSGGKGHEE